MEQAVQERPEARLVLQVPARPTPQECQQQDAKEKQEESAQCTQTVLHARLASVRPTDVEWVPDARETPHQEHQHRAAQLSKFSRSLKSPALCGTFCLVE